MIENVIVAVVGDIHANSTVALCPPRFTLDDGGYKVPSNQQRWLWHHWLQYWKEVKEAKQRHDAELYVVFNGEIADDLNHNSTQLMSRNPADQLRNAINTIKPALDIGDHFIVTRGTEAHSGTSACLDEIIADDISAIPDPENGRASWWHFIGDIGGVRFDISHHAGSSYSRPSTAGGAANRIAADLTYYYAKHRVICADLAFRGHTHRRGDSHDNHPVRVVVNPSWQLTNAFGHKLAGGGAATLPIGGAYVICNNGEPQVIKKYKEWPLKSKIWNPSRLQKTN